MSADDLAAAATLKAKADAAAYRATELWAHKVRLDDDVVLEPLAANAELCAAGVRKSPSIAIASPPSTQRLRPATTQPPMTTAICEWS